MCNRIRTAMDERGLKPTPFAKSIGVKVSTMFSIYRGEVAMERIAVDNFIRIAHGLDMTVEELYYGESPEPSDLSDDERSVIDGYRKLDIRGKRAVARTIEGELDDIDGEFQEQKGVA